jgi:diadenosine tetraphosphate (Ap4A) HIT family hydrolase
MVENVSELHQLDAQTYAAAMDMARRCGVVLKDAFAADKINTAAIGNMVAQLHIHVVARSRDDAAWPGPVWGAGTMQRLDPAEAERRIGLIQKGLGAA